MTTEDADGLGVGGGAYLEDSLERVHEAVGEEVRVLEGGVPHSQVGSLFATSGVKDGGKDIVRHII